MPAEEVLRSIIANFPNGIQVAEEPPYTVRENGKMMDDDRAARVGRYLCRVLHNARKELAREPPPKMGRP